MQKTHCWLCMADNYFLHMAHRINNQLTFIHIPKNAGTSIFHWIEKYHKWKFDGVHHQHVDSVRPAWRDQMFCVVRNPWHRAVSWYFFVKQMLRKKNRGTMRNYIQPQLDKLDEGFESFITTYHSTVFKKSVYWSSSVVFTLKSIAHTNYIGENFSGIVLRYENLKEDFEQIQEITKCKSPLPVDNVTVYPDKEKWKKHYNDKTIESVYNLFKKDIEIFKYKFD